MAKKKARRGRPKGSGKKRGRPPVRKTTAGSMTLPVDTQVDLMYWSELVVFLNANKGKNFIVKMDGTSYTLLAE